MNAEIANIDAICKSIGEWHRHIFGEYDPSDHVRAIAQKAEEESRELYASPTDPMEAADLIICGLAALDRMGYFPSEMVREKLEILKGRGVSQLERDQERGIIQARDCNPNSGTDRSSQ